MSVSSGFSDLVVTGERIESCIKNGKIQCVVAASNGAKKPYSDFTKKNKGEANATSTSKGKGKSYQAPYYQVAEMAPNHYQQQTYVVPTSQQPIQYQSPI